MKKMSVITLIAAVMLLFFASACSKDRDAELNLPDQKLVDARIEKIVEKANLDYLSAKIIGGDVQVPFQVANDGLIDAYLANEQLLSPENNPRINKLIACLQSTNLTNEQIPLVRQKLEAFKNRNQSIIQRHRQAFATLKANIEERRLELAAQLANGTITQVEFRRQMQILHQRFHAGLIRIKESNAEAFARSFRILMQNLKTILTPGQWDGFKACMLA